MKLGAYFPHFSLYPQGMCFCCPVDWSLGWPKVLLGHCVEAKTIFPAKNRNTAVQPVARDCTEGEGSLAEDFTKLKRHHYIQFGKLCTYLRF